MAVRDDWTETTIGEICDVRDGTHDSPKQSVDGYPLVTSKNIRNGKVDMTDTYLISESDFFAINKRSKVDQFDLLISMIGTVGEVCIEVDQPNYAIKNVGLIKTGNELLGRFLLHYLSSSLGQSQIGLSTSGSTQKFIGLGKLRELKVVLPPVAEQRRIVNVVSSVDAYIDALQQQVHTARTARNAVLHELLSAGGDGWTEATVGSLLSRSIGGVWGTEPGTDQEEVMVVRSTEFTKSGVLNYATGVPRSIKSGQLASRELAEGDILLEKSGGGPEQPVGRVVYVESEIPPRFVCSNFIQLLTPVRGVVLPRFLFFVMWMWHFQNKTLEYQAQTTGIRNLRTPDYLEQLILLPPIAEQRRIVNVVSSMDDVIQAAERAVVEAKKLRSGLLSDLLSGEHEIPVSYDELLGAA